MKRSYLVLVSLLFTPCPVFSEKPFGDELWKGIQPLYQEILKHPFLKGLTDGTLPEESFRYYIEQDALYLSDFSRALTLASTKSPDDNWSALFAQHARDCLAEERLLHENYFKQWGTDKKKSEETPTNQAYTSYLFKVASQDSFEELLGALLPCYWIYWEVGKALKAKGSPNAQYQRWIDNYGSEEYGAAIMKVIEIMNKSAEGLSDQRKAEIKKRFYIASRYEWMFWDAAWRLERWPLENKKLETLP